jgi:hypothetical protein
MKLTTLEDMWRFAQYAHKAGIRRRSLTSAEQAFCVIQYGDELGIGPMASLKGITFKGDTPTVDGDLALALVRASGKCSYVTELFDLSKQVATCIAKRVDQDKEIVSTFSIDDAKKAGLTGKSGPWKEYTNRMIRYRALGFCLRDAFPEVMQSIHITQEIEEDEPLAVPETDVPPRDERRTPAQMPEEEPKTSEVSQPEETPPVAPPKVNDATLKALRKGVWNKYLDRYQLSVNTPDELAAAQESFLSYCYLVLGRTIESGGQLTLEDVQKLNTALDAGGEE